MKFIALDDFANPNNNCLTLSKGHEHVKDAFGDPLKNHIHKGAEFEIGSAEKVENLSTTDRMLVAQLKHAKKISEATTDTVAQVKKEVETAKKRDAADKKSAGVSLEERIAAACTTAVAEALAPVLKLLAPKGA